MRFAIVSYYVYTVLCLVLAGCSRHIQENASTPEKQQNSDGTVANTGAPVAPVANTSKTEVDPSKTASKTDKQ